MTYVMSDVHSCYARFLDVLDQIGLSDDDVLYVIGDTIDRGPNGIDVLRHVMDGPNMVLLVGNHEDMLLAAMTGEGPRSYYMRDIWIANGGGPVLDAFEALPSHERNDVLNYLAALPEKIDLDIAGKSYHLVHASPGRDRRSRLWENMSPYLPRTIPGKTVIVGHVPACNMRPSPSSYLTRCNSHMEIFHGNGFIDIDCGCGKGKRLPKNALACLRLDDMAEFYSTV